MSFLGMLPMLIRESPLAVSHRALGSSSHSVDLGGASEQQLLTGGLLVRVQPEEPLTCGEWHPGPSLVQTAARHSARREHVRVQPEEPNPINNFRRSFLRTSR